MNIKDIIAAKKNDFFDSVCLMGVIPLLVFVYLLLNKISSYKILSGEIGYILLATIAVFVMGIVVGRRMLMSLIIKLIDDNQRIVSMQQELIEKNRLSAITEMTLSLGHELNNPLLAISGNLEMIEMELPKDKLPEAIRKRFETIKGHCERIRQVSEQISRIAKPVLSTIHGDVKMVDLGKSVK